MEACTRRRIRRKIKDDVERKTTIPRKHQCHVKAMKDEVKIEDYNMKEGRTIEMTLRLQGGMKNDESMASAGIAEERQVKRRTPEPCSAISGIDDVRLSEMIANIESASKKIKCDDATNGMHGNTDERTGDQVSQ